MNALLVTLLLFVPFILVGAVTGIIYLISGYKKGLYRSLFSLGITVVSILVSILLANIISTAVSGPVVNLLPVDSLADRLGVLSSFAVTMIQGAVKVALAFVFFVILLFIALIILKLVGNRIKWEKLDMKDPDDKKMKFAGLAVRAVDTLLVTFMLLLPFYGSLAVLMPSVYVSSGTASAPVDDNMIVASTAVYSEGDSMQDIVDAINHHPLVSAYRIGPTDWVMRSLSDMGGDLENVNAIEAADTISRLTGLITAFSNVDGDERYEILHQICDILKDDVIGKDWCYSLVIAAKSDFEKMVDEAAKNDPDVSEIRTYLDMLDMSREEFDANATAIVDFISYAIDNNFDKFYETSDYTALSEDFYKELGSLINCSKQAISLKKLFYINAAEELYYDSISDMVTDSYDSDEDERRALATAFVDTYFKDGKVNKKDYTSEGEAFMLAFFSRSYSDSVDAFVRHPLFGAESMKEHIDSSVAIDNYDINNRMYHHINPDFLTNNEKINTYLHNGMDSFEKISITDARYTDYMRSVFSLISYTDEKDSMDQLCFISTSEKALKVLLDQAKADKFESSAISFPEAVYDALTAIYALSKDKAFVNNEISLSYIHNLTCYKKGAFLWPERYVTLEECGNKIGYYDEETGEYLTTYENAEAYAAYSVFRDFETDISYFINVSDYASIFNYMTENMGYKNGATISDNQKAMLDKALELAYNEYYIDATKIDPRFEGAVIMTVTSETDGIGEMMLRLADGTVESLENGMPYGYRRDLTNFGAIHAISEDEITSNNNSINECIKAIKAFFGI